MDRLIIIIILNFSIFFVVPAKARAFDPGKNSDGLNIAINPPIELDFKTKKEILDLRRSYVNQYPQLSSAGYQPADKVFGQIQDKAGWVGIEGIICYGPGQKSIAGAAEESRFLVNPYLLVGVMETTAHHIGGQGGACPDNYLPEALKLFWDNSSGREKVSYKVTPYINMSHKYHYPNAGELYLVAYNARDFGFNYLYVDPGRTQGINMSNLALEPVLLRQFIHCGGSCGYPGGCNNMSPIEPHMAIKVSSLPAQVYVKLWKNIPADRNQKADFTVIIEME